MKATIYASELRAAMEFVAKDQSRRVLCGVYVRTTDKIDVVATDSYRMVDMETAEKPDEQGECILDLSGIKLPTKKGTRVCVWYEDGKNEARLVFTDKTITVPIIEGNYPDFEKLLPNALNKGKANDRIAEAVTRMTVNPSYVYKCGKALDMWAEHKNHPMPLEFRGETKPVYHESRDELRTFRAIIMPVRADKTRYLDQPASARGGAKLDEVERELKTYKEAHEELMASYKKKCDEVRKLEEKLDGNRSLHTKALQRNQELKNEIEAAKAEAREPYAKKIQELEAELEALRKAETEEPVSQDDNDEVNEIVSQFIAEHECAYLAGETSAAYYIGGIKEGTPEHKAIKELGAGFAKRHKKHPNTWYFKKTA